MSRSRMRLDHRGFREMLTSPAVGALMGRIAADVGSHVDEVDDHGRPVEVLTGTYTTDRVNGVVTMAHPGGLAIEASRGSLARALAAEGLPLSGGGA